MTDDKQPTDDAANPQDRDTSHLLDPDDKVPGPGLDDEILHLPDSAFEYQQDYGAWPIAGMEVSEPRQETRTAFMPPHNIDIEQTLLGLIIAQGEPAYKKASEHITAAAFYGEGHKLIFQLIGRLITQGVEPSRMTIADALVDHGKKEHSLHTENSVNHYTYQLKLMLESIDWNWGENPESLAKMIAHHYRARLAMITMQVGIQGIQNQKSDLPGIITSVTDRLRKLLDQGTVQVPYKSAGTEAREAYAALDTPLMATVPIGVPYLDKNAGGLAEAECWGMMAAPNRGKTKIGLALAVMIAMNHQTTWINLEMSPARWYNYLMPAISSTGLMPVNAGQLFKEPPGPIRDTRWKDVILDADKLWLRMMHRPQGADNQLLRLMMLDAIDQGAKVLFIDQYIKIKSFTDGQNNDNRGQKAEAIYLISDICKENNVTGFIFHQANRSGYKNPGIGSGFDTAAFEQICDHVVTFVDLQKNLIEDNQGFCLAKNGFPIPPTKADWKELTDGNPTAVLTETTWLRPIDFCLTKTRGEQVGRKAIWFDYSLGCCVEIIGGRKVPMTQSNLLVGG